MNYPDISFIIPNFNGEKYLSECLQSIHQNIKSVSIITEIILVDNGSTDNSPTFFIRFCKQNEIKYQLIKNTENCGFAKAVNQGIKKSKYSYVCVTNNDLTLNLDWLKTVFDSLSKTATTSLGSICGTVLNKDGTLLESQGIEFQYSGKCINRFNGKKFSTKYINQRPFIVWGTSAALAIYDKSAVTKAGLFDEKFFAYLEDVDLAFRLNNLGYTCLCIPKAISYHLGGGTSSKFPIFREYYTFVNWFRLIIKNYSTSQIIRNLPSIIIERLRNFSYLLRSIFTYLTYNHLK